MTIPSIHPEHSKTLAAWASYAGVWPKLAVLLGVLAGVMLIAQAWLLAKVLNAALFDQADVADLMPWLGGLLLVFLLRAACNWVGEQAALRGALQVKLQLRQLLYAKVQNLGPAWLS